LTLQKTAQLEVFHYFLLAGEKREKIVPFRAAISASLHHSRQSEKKNPPTRPWFKDDILPFIYVA
jgi:hypothetical protein